MNAGATVGAASMRVQVDLTKGIGYAQCCFAAPRVFQMTGTEALECDASPKRGEDDAVRRAAGGVRIPKGAPLILLLAAANRDSDRLVLAVDAGWSAA